MIKSTEDYLAKLNIEGKRDVWKRNHEKIDSIVGRTCKQLHSYMHICEVGLGDGYLLRHLLLKYRQVTGVDVSTYLIEYHRKVLRKWAHKMSLILGDISEVDLGEEPFDVVFALDVLEHIPGEALIKAVEKITISLKHGGLLIVSLPYKENLANNMTQCPQCGHVFHPIGHYHQFDSIAEIEGLFMPSLVIVDSFRVYSTGLLGLAQRIFRFVIVLFKKKFYHDTICIVLKKVR